MKVASFKGSDFSTKEGMKVFKPVSSLVLCVSCLDPAKSWADYKEPEIRVRLVDGKKGSSHEIVPQMLCDTLSDVAAKTEGFQRRMGYKFDNSQAKKVRLSGRNQYTIVLNSLAAVDLSNDKYLDIDVFNCVDGFKYELYGIEHNELSMFVRTVKKFYLSGGELEKTFSVEDNELLCLPLRLLKEVQFFTKNNSTSPVFSAFELELLEDQSNDIQNLCINEDNKLSVVNGYSDLAHKDGSNVLFVQGGFGFDKWAVIDITPYSRFEVRRNDGTEALMFFMIDSAETRPTSTTAAAVASALPTANVNKAAEILENVVVPK